MMITGALPREAHMRNARTLVALTIAASAASLACGAAHAQEERAWTVEQLLTDGWQLAGYIGTADNRSSLMLFKHPDRRYLVQCSVLYDVLRYKRIQTHCYEVH
jgi:hypothetical protein